MAPPRKNASNAAIVAISKDKSTAAGGAGLTTYPPHPDVLIEYIKEDQSSSPAPPDVGTNSTKHNSLPKVNYGWGHLDEQRVEAAREREKAALNRDAAAHIQNQLATQIGILRKSHSSKGNWTSSGWRRLANVRRLL